MITEINGYKTAYADTGSGGQAVVILQGWGTTYQVYDSIAACLKKKYRVIQFDFPGFGESDEPKEAWNVDRYADFFVSFMEKLGIHKAILLGHSYGGRVIIKLAARKRLPFEIERIVLVDSAGIVPKKSFSQKVRAKRYKFLKALFCVKWIYALFPELIDNWRQRQGSEDYRNASPIMRQCLVMAVNEDLSHLFSDIRQEVLLVWGDEDTATPLSDAKKMEELMPEAGLAVIRGAGHFCFLDSPVVFQNILKSYLGME